VASLDRRCHLDRVDARRVRCVQDLVRCLAEPHVCAYRRPTLRAVRRREWQEVYIDPLDEGTRREVVRVYIDS